MKNVGDFCWRDKNNNAFLELPFRIQLPDGTTRTDPSQYSTDDNILQLMSWTKSILDQNDIDKLFPPEPPLSPLEIGFDTGLGWNLGWKPDDVALLTGLYVLAKRAKELNIDQPIIVLDTNSQTHTLTFEEYEDIMLRYGYSRSLLMIPTTITPQPQASNHT